MANKKTAMQSNQSNFLLYTAVNGDIKIEAQLQNETIWLTQKAMGELFGKSKATISEHVSTIFAQGELAEEAVVRDFRTTATDPGEL